MPSIVSANAITGDHASPPATIFGTVVLGAGGQVQPQCFDFTVSGNCAVVTP